MSATPPSPNARLLLVGCGKMGGAMLAGWIDQGTPPANITVIEPDADTGVALEDRFGVNVLADAGALGPDPFDVVLFAVKPQVIDAVVPAFKALARPDTVFLSIAAGKPIAAFEALLGEDAAIIRTMPNTPAAIHKGITVAVANGHVRNAQIALCQMLLEAVGQVAWIDDESLMDAVTAVSGSGPAYVFLLAECLAEAGIKAGLPADLAAQLARATIAGAGALLGGASETPTHLRANVTSPGGTTAAALEVLMEKDGLSALLTRAVQAAKARSKELAG